MKIPTGAVLSIVILVVKVVSVFTKSDLSVTIPSGMLMDNEPSPTVFEKENSYTFSFVLSDISWNFEKLTLIIGLLTKILTFSLFKLFLMIFFSFSLICPEIVWVLLA